MSAIPDLEDTWEKIEEMRAAYLCPVDVFGCHMLSDSADTPDGRFRYAMGLLLSARNLDRITALAMYKLNHLLPVLPGTLDTARLQSLDAEFGEKTKGLQKLRSANKMLKTNFPEDIVNTMKLNTWKLTAKSVFESGVEELSQIIHPVGFSRQKAENMKAIAKICLESYAGDIPKDLAGVLKLPGFGPKMGHLLVQIVYGQVEGISVDTHVCRITQRLRWVRDGMCEPGGKMLDPDNVAKQLVKTLPKDKWRDINPLLVGFGQTLCKATLPECNKCMLAGTGRCYYKGAFTGSSGKPRNRERRAKATRRERGDDMGDEHQNDDNGSNNGGSDSSSDE